VTPAGEVEGGTDGEAGTVEEMTGGAPPSTDGGAPATDGGT
jgi:hypothetical protein